MGSGAANRVRAAVPVDQPVTEAQETPRGWQSDYLIQLVQAMTTGAGVGVTVAIVWYWSARGAPLPDWWLPACASVAIVWTVVWTIFRYHGDEIGLFQAAYRAGQRSRDAEVNHLIMQLETERDAATAASGGTSTTDAEKRIAVANATLQNARKLLRVVYEHGAAHGTREQMAQRGMGQRDWERARALCVAAGATDNLLQPLLGSYADALAAVERTHGAGVAEMRKSRRGRVVWA